MNGDEDLGQDIQMKGELYHYQQKPQKWLDVRAEDGTPQQNPVIHYAYPDLELEAARAAAANPAPETPPAEGEAAPAEGGEAAAAEGEAAAEEAPAAFAQRTAFYDQHNGVWRHAQPKFLA